jgi:hypothetical protein
MSEVKQEIKRVENWMTQGRPRVIRTRGGTRTRGAVATAPGVTIGRIEEVQGLLEQLKEDVPELPWVVVVDGSVDSFAEGVCMQAQQVREGSKFWIVGPEKEIPREGVLAPLTPLHLNPQDADDLQFLTNLVADLAIVSLEPKASQMERVRRWLSQARYILAEELKESLIEELRMTEPAGAKATILVLKGEE